MEVTEEQQRLLNKWDNFCAAHIKAAQAKGTVGPKIGPGESFGMGGSWERQRGLLYQQLVKMGLMPQIKKKYRNA
jgi:hypothetical protein